MLRVHISAAAGTVVAQGICSDSGFFPVAVASIYNRALDEWPLRRLLNWDTSPDIGSDPEGTRRAIFGYTQTRGVGDDCRFGDEVVSDDEVVLQVERI